MTRRSGPKRKRRARGEGCVFRRGTTWWIKYNGPDGRPHSESSESPKKGDAERLLRLRLGTLDPWMVRKRERERNKAKHGLPVTDAELPEALAKQRAEAHQTSAQLATESSARARERRIVNAACDYVFACLPEARDAQEMVRARLKLFLVVLDDPAVEEKRR